MALKIANLDWLLNDPMLHLAGEAIQSVSQALENLSTKLSINSQGDTRPPAPHSAVNVVAKGGVTHVSLMDNNPRTSQVHNFVEWDTDRNFSNAQPIHLGPTRQVRIPTFMGVTPVYVRSYTQHSDGQRSEFSYHGTKQNPTPIIDGATIPGPTPPPTTGSGTSPVAGHGFGVEPFVSSPTNPGKRPSIF
jgi:hypothetical protein